jgi:hypothetical protein
VKVVIANCSPPVASDLDFDAFWASHERPQPVRPRLTLFEQQADWGFHIEALGVYLLDLGLADEVEFWDFSDERLMLARPNGVLWIKFANEDDAEAYLRRYGDPDLFINHGGEGQGLLRRLEGRAFRVDVPAFRSNPRRRNENAECYLVDGEEWLDARSMLYVPVVNTARFHPAAREKQRDFVYLAVNYEGKRHDLAVDAARGTGITGHLHPVDASLLDLSGAAITTSGWNELDVVELLRSSRIAVYPADHASSPAAMWECVATGLPIVVNRALQGGKHVVVPGVTGELAAEADFRATIESVLRRLDEYSPSQYFAEHWDTVELLDSYLAFFARMGWGG